MLPNAAVAGLHILSIPGLSAEQVSGLMTAFKIAMDQAFDRRFGPLQQPLQQPNPSPPIPPPTQPNSLAKKKRNQKTRQQYKQGEAQVKAQALRVTNQEVEHSEVQITVVENASKHVVLHRKAPWDCVATLLHAIIVFVRSMIESIIMVQNGTIEMPRMGVG